MQPKSQKEEILDHVRALQEHAKKMQEHPEDQHIRNQGYRLEIRLDYIYELIDDSML